MIIKTQEEFAAMQEISEAVGQVLAEMKAFTKPGMSTKQIDLYGASIMNELGIKSAPNSAYKFPGYTCICVNNEVAHGIPSDKTIVKSGDLINIDVSGVKNGYWADNGGSFILGEDTQNLDPLVQASKEILHSAIQMLSPGLRISDIGKYIETEAKSRGLTVIRNLVGHGVGRSLHEDPSEIPCYYDRFNFRRFKKDVVIALETFISTKASLAKEKGDGWTYITKDGSFVAQHEHTIWITEDGPKILTHNNMISTF